jgi:hypothetical protein
MIGRTLGLLKTYWNNLCDFSLLKTLWAFWNTVEKTLWVCGKMLKTCWGSWNTFETMLGLLKKMLK